jgi:hypothetical protein
MKKITRLFLFLAAFVACGTAANAQSNIDFEVSGQTWTWSTFENGLNPNTFSVVANPNTAGINTSATCAKYIINADGAPWAGVESKHGADIVPFKFNADNSIIKMMVYKSVISPVGLKFAENNGDAQPEVKVSNTKINEWEELTFDLSGSIGKGATGIIDQIIIFPDFPASRTAGSICYFDNIKFGVGSVVNDTQAPTAFTATKGAVNGNSVELLLNGTDNSGSVVYVITYGSNTVTTYGTSGVQKSYIVSGLSTSTAYSFSVVAKDAAGNLAANNPIVVQATTTAVITSGIPTINFETVGQNWAWTVFGNGPGGADTPANLTSPVANPSATGINTSASCLKFIEAPTALPWGGFFSDNIGTLTFDAMNKIVKVMVYKDKISPFGVKFEGQGGNPAFELLVSNTKINEWEELTFNFTNKIGQTVKRLVFLPDFATPRASGGTTYIDNISFGDGTTAVDAVSADKNAFTCYPNPAVNQLTVSAEKEMSQFIVRNLVGQSIKTVTVKGLQKTIDLSDIAAGNYFVTVKMTDGQLSTQKFVKL